MYTKSIKFKQKSTITMVLSKRMWAVWSFERATNSMWTNPLAMASADGPWPGAGTSYQKKK